MSGDAMMMPYVGWVKIHGWNGGVHPVYAWFFEVMRKNIFFLQCWFILANMMPIRCNRLQIFEKHPILTCLASLCPPLCFHASVVGLLQISDVGCEKQRGQPPFATIATCLKFLNDF